MSWRSRPRGCATSWRQARPWSWRLDQNIYRRLPVGFEQIRRYTLARTDLLIARGDEALAVSRKSGFQGAYEFVEYGIDTGTFYPRATDQAVRPDPRPFRIGYVGRLVPEKGLIDVVEALHRCGRPVEFELLATDPSGPGSCPVLRKRDWANAFACSNPATPPG